MSFLSKLKKKAKRHLNPLAGIDVAIPGAQKLNEKLGLKDSQDKLRETLDPEYLVNKTHEVTGLRSTKDTRLEKLPDIPGIDDPQVVDQILQEQNKLRKRRGILSTKLTGAQGLLGSANERRPSLLAGG